MALSDCAPVLVTPLRKPDYGSFELGFSHIYDRTGRETALREIVRVMKDGARLAVVDIRHTADYAAILETDWNARCEKARPELHVCHPVIYRDGNKALKLSLIAIIRSYRNSEAIRLSSKGVMP
jgi:hypothetical protein